MGRFVGQLQTLYGELRRRRVYRMAGLYAVSLFVLLQIADATFDPLGIPPVWVAVVIVVGVAGFPVAVVLAWMFDLTDEGIRQEDPGSLADMLGRTRVRRATTVLCTASASLMLGVSAWHIAVSDDATVVDGSAAEERLPDLDPQRIAVLYFDDHSEDGSLGYLAAELTEGLLNELGNVEGLEVASRNAVKPYRYAAVPLDSVVRHLGVGSLVEGSVTRAGNRVRATVQLIDGRTLSHMASQMVEGTLDDPFAFQDSLTSYVGRALRQRLGREVRVRFARAGTHNASAWTAYARGRDELEGYQAFREVDKGAANAALLRADSLFREAERHDPGWPAPLVHQAVVAGRLAALHGPLPGAMDTARARVAESLLARVLERDPDAGEALAFRGWLRARLARTPGIPRASEILASAEEDLRAALALNPRSAQAWWTLSEILVRRARFLEAVDAAEHALKADAFLEVEEQALFSLQYSVSQLGPVDEAVRLCDEGRRRFPLNANFVACRFVILGSYPQVAPDVANARALFDSLVVASPAGDRETWQTLGKVWLARVFARAGQADSARAMLDQVRRPGRTPPVLAYDEAHIQLLLGDRAAAVELLRLHLTSDPDTAFLREDWWFEPLRNFRPFRELVGLAPADPGGS